MFEELLLELRGNWLTICMRFGFSASAAAGPINETETQAVCHGCTRISEMISSSNEDRLWKAYFGGGSEPEFVPFAL